MVNIFGGRANVVVARATATFSSAGITALNTEIIYEASGTLKSYVPGRQINGVTGFEENKGYYIIAKQDMDLSNLVAPPIELPPPEVDYVLDTFVGTTGDALQSHPTNSGESWEVITGGVVIRNNAAAGSASFRNVKSIAVIDAGTNNVTIEANVNLLNVGSKPAGIALRVVDDQNYYYTTIQAVGNGFRLYKVVAGVETLVSFAAITQATTLMTAICTDDRIRVFFGSSIVEDTAATAGQSSTKFGLYLFRDTESGDDAANHVDNISDFMLWEGEGRAPVNEFKQFSLDYPQNFQVFQRTTGVSGPVKVKGAVYNTGGLVNVEARLNGGAWATIATGINSEFEGQLNGQSGQGTFEIRTTDLSRLAQVANVGIGDVFIIAGQSNASGYGGTAQLYTHATLKAGLFGNSYRWMELRDPTDFARAQVDAVSADGPATGGSYWPVLATKLLARNNVPVAFVTCPMGGTSILMWQPGSNHQDRTTLYGSMVYRALQVLDFKAILWHQGESDATINGFTGGATYKTRLKSFADAVFTDLGVPIIITRIHYWNEAPSTTEANVEEINQAMVDAAAENSHILLGPDLHDPTNVSTALHFQTNGEYEEIATRWDNALDALGY
jgi:hypothetical protein